VRYSAQVTAFPVGITTGSTWDIGIDVFERVCSWVVQSSSPTSHSDLVGIGMGAKALGFHVQLGPVGGRLGKIAEAGWDVQLRGLASWRSYGGRNWEGFSNDPYLASVAMAQVRLVT
jgi:beta-glucosidase